MESSTGHPCPVCGAPVVQDSSGKGWPRIYCCDAHRLVADRARRVARAKRRREADELVWHGEPIEPRLFDWESTVDDTADPWSGQP